MLFQAKEVPTFGRNATESILEQLVVEPSRQKQDSSKEVCRPRIPFEIYRTGCKCTICNHGKLKPSCTQETDHFLHTSVGGVEDSTLSGAFGASSSTGAAAGSVDFVSVFFQIDSFRTLERKLGLLSFSSGFASETDVGSTAIDSGSSLTGASFPFAFSPCKNFPFSFWKRLGLEVSAILVSGSGAASVALAVDQFSSHLVKSVQKFTVKLKTR